MYNYGSHYIDKDDVKNVVNVLKKSLLTQGKFVTKFENQLKNYIGCKHTLAVSSGTAALHLISKSLGWTNKDIILAPSITFAATVNSIIYSNAKPEFVDIDNDDYSISPKEIEKIILKLKKKNKKVKALIVVDYGGQPAKWKEIYRLKKKYNFQIVSDNCHSYGAKYYKKKSYATLYADMVSLSFHPVKHITTGEGGAILTNNTRLYHKCKILRSHGIIKSNRVNVGKKINQLNEIGYNYRLSDIQCALGISQLNKIDFFIKKRRDIAKVYNSIFRKNSNFIIPEQKKNCFHSYHLYPLLIDFKNFKISKKNFIKRLEKKKIFVQMQYVPIYKYNFYRRKFGLNKKILKNSENFYSKEISLPIYYSMKKKDVIFIAKTIFQILNIKFDVRY